MIKVTNKKGLLAAQGFRTVGIAAGIKKNNKKDLMVVLSDAPMNATGIFTNNQFAAAPVALSQKNLKAEKVHAGLIINSGSANACTGAKGYQDAVDITSAIAKLLACKPSQVLMASTGVIGQRLPMEKIKNVLPLLIESAQAKESGSAAEAIMTTDTWPKLAETSVMINDCKVSIGGIAKGSGMIRPNMATMLAVITTDIDLPKQEMNQCLKQAAQGTFNAISVDGENSTNDSVFLFANAKAGKQSRPENQASKQLFVEALTAVLDNLAEQIVLDGEGATKFIEIVVKNAQHANDAMTAARAIGDSQLVKTAVYGQDANWGRILQSLGATKVSLNPLKIDVAINGLQLVKNGIDAGVSIKKSNSVLKKKRITIEVDLHVGTAKARYRTCDLTKAYVDINAGYRS